MRRASTHPEGQRGARGSVARPDSRDCASGGDRRCNLVCAPPGPSRLLAQSIATGQEPVDVDAPERSDADAGQLAFRESFALSGRTSY